MMASNNLPEAVSSACSVMETTRMPLRLSMDLKATACSRFRVKRLNFQTRVSWKVCLACLPFVQHPAELGPNGDVTALRPCQCNMAGGTTIEGRS